MGAVIRWYCARTDKDAILETLTVAELAALLAAMQQMPRLRGQALTKDKLLAALRQAMDAQPAHADQQKVRAGTHTARAEYTLQWLEL